MNIKRLVSRITVDLPSNLQKKLKTFAAMQGKSMRAVVIEPIKKQLRSSENKKIYNFFE